MTCLPAGRYTHRMSRQLTQFAVALAAILLLGVVTIIAVWAAAFQDGPPEFAFAGITALATACGQAVAYLFRLNGSQRT